jgi:hypothetical protein
MVRSVSNPGQMVRWCAVDSIENRFEEVMGWGF